MTIQSRKLDDFRSGNLWVVMLQRSRDHSVAETCGESNLTIGSSSLLQWSRDLSVAETARDVPLDGVNILLQWSRDHSVAET